MGAHDRYTTSSHPCSLITQSTIQNRISSSNYYINNGSSISENDDHTVRPLIGIKQPYFQLVIFIVAYSIIFVAALVGNAMIVMVVYIRPGMRSVTNLFIANLAVADILVAIFCIPMTLADNLFYGWPFGWVLCRLTPYIQGVTVCASVYILAAIAVDRYLAICFKPQFRIMRRGAILTLVSIWLFSFALIVPWLVYYRHIVQPNKHDICRPRFPSSPAERAYYFAAIFVGTYILPLGVIFLCYTLIARRVWQRKAPGVAIGRDVIKRYRIKVIKMLVTVVTVFALFWMPLHTLHIVIEFSTEEQTKLKHIMNIGVPIAQWLELSNSGVNPFIYCFFSENFRRGVSDLLRCVFRRHRYTYSTGASIAAQRRVPPSFSDESMITGSSLIQRAPFSSRVKNNRALLRTSLAENRAIWRNGSLTEGSVQSIEHRPVSVLKQLSNTDIELLPLRNTRNGRSIVEIDHSHRNV